MVGGEVVIILGVLLVSFSFCSLFMCVVLL